MKLQFIVIFTAFYFTLFSQSSTFKSSDLTGYVDPMIGTMRMGHTYPGATTPFGMVQLSPETSQQPMFKDGKYNKDVYRYCSGYQYEDSTIYGFAHTHFSGTGHSDLGDFLLMPTSGKLRLNAGNRSTNEPGYNSLFLHKTELAEPGYYKVHLDDYDIDVELTATDRVGFHNYTYNESDSNQIVYDLRSNIYNYEGRMYGHLYVLKMIHLLPVTGKLQDGPERVPCILQWFFQNL